MPTLVIRNVEDDVHRRLKARAKAHGRSAEEEVRVMLREALSSETNSGRDLVAAIRALFEPLGGLELPEMPQDPVRPPPDFGSIGQ